MLSWLHIKNLALIDELALEFPSGLVILTGETGAGKSVILGALQLLLGQRADRSLIRSGAESCLVEGLFKLEPFSDPLIRLLDEHGIEVGKERELLIKRIVHVSGGNRQFINDTAVTLNFLQQIGEWLVDIHGPYDHQSLLKPAAQLQLLDAFGRLTDLRKRVAALYEQQTELLQRIKALEADERTVAQQIDLLHFQVREIESAGFKPGDEEQLLERFERLTNASRLAELCSQCLVLLSEDESSVLARLHRLGRLLNELTGLDKSVGHLLRLHESALSASRELEYELRRYFEVIEFDPAEAQQIEQRMYRLQQLKKKYGSTVEEILSYAENARQKLQLLERRDEELNRLRAELERVTSLLNSESKGLSKARHEIATELAQRVTTQLRELGFKDCRLEFHLTELPKPGPTGIDELEILFAPNPGEPLRPLRNIASSGEIARVMLALKSVLADVDQISVLVFDEVDANVGGETALSVGRRMRAIAHYHQVFCVTHLPVVAALATCHYKVWKEVNQGRTFTRAQRLDKEERIQELARMLGGGSEASKALARHLLETAMSYAEL